jgi:hypothetical protein
MSLDSYEIVTLDLVTDPDGNLPVSPYVINAPAGKQIISAGMRINDGFNVWMGGKYDYPAPDGSSWTFCFVMNGIFTGFIAPDVIKIDPSLQPSADLQAELPPDTPVTATTRDMLAPASLAMLEGDIPITLWAVCA